VFIITLNPSIFFIDLFLFLRTYACSILPFLSGKTTSMSSKSSSPHQLERRIYNRIVHRAYPRGRLHIETEIEEENPMDMRDDESVEDETYRMSPVPPSENNAKDEIESNDSGVRHEIEEEEEEERMVEGTLNPRS
jgi:hypothetical protein